MQAIRVKHFLPTNTKPHRVQAVAAAGKGPIISVHHYTNEDAAVLAAAKTLAARFGWSGTYVRGDLEDGTPVFVCNNATRDTFTL
jgi:hypothetical protein